MNHQFKPGDLAMIVGTFSVPENIGKTCELIELLAPEEVSTWVNPVDGNHVQNGDVTTAWLITGEGILGADGCDLPVLVLPQHLLPLRDDFTPVERKVVAEPHANT